MSDAINYLNWKFGQKWSSTFTPWGDKLICHLTVNGVTRSAVGIDEESAFMKAYGYFDLA